MIIKTSLLPKIGAMSTANPEKMRFYVDLYKVDLETKESEGTAVHSLVFSKEPKIEHKHVSSRVSMHSPEEIQNIIDMDVEVNKLDPNDINVHISQEDMEWVSKVVVEWYEISV